MQLSIRRSWIDTEAVLTCQIRMTEEEHSLLEKFNLYNSRIFGPHPDYNLVDFLRGVTISVSKGSTVDVNRLGTFFYQEDQLVERIDGFCKLLDRCRSFSQETVVEFPREDDTVEVRVKNVVRTSSS